jgi:hypothetical protein
LKKKNFKRIFLGYPVIIKKSWAEKISKKKH